MPLLGDSDALWQFMDSRMVKCTFKAQAQDFLPAKALMEATRREVIKNIVLKDENLRLSPSETSEFIDRICHEGCKLFLSCVYCSMPMSCLRNLMNMGFTDSNLPRTVDDCPSTENKRLFKTGFLVNLKRFYAPVFNMNSYQILDDTSPMPIDLEEELGNLLGRGAFGEVWNINIHADHFSFSVVSSGKAAARNIADVNTEQGRREPLCDQSYLASRINRAREKIHPSHGGFQSQASCQMHGKLHVRRQVPHDL